MPSVACLEECPGYGGRTFKMMAGKPCCHLKLTQLVPSIIILQLDYIIIPKAERCSES